MRLTAFLLDKAANHPYVISVVLLSLVGWSHNVSYEMSLLRWWQTLIELAFFPFPLRRCRRCPTAGLGEIHGLNFPGDFVSTERPVLSARRHIASRFFGVLGSVKCLHFTNDLKKQDIIWLAFMTPCSSKQQFSVWKKAQIISKSWQMLHLWLCLQSQLLSKCFSPKETLCVYRSSSIIPPKVLHIIITVCICASKCGLSKNFFLNESPYCSHEQWGYLEDHIPLPSPCLLISLVDLISLISPLPLLKE